MSQTFLAKRESWEDEARCKDLDPDLFFSRDKVSEKIAKAECMKCTVREQCLEFALEHNIQHGTWGGLNDDERITFRRRIRRKKSA